MTETYHRMHQLGDQRVRVELDGLDSVDIARNGAPLRITSTGEGRITAATTDTVEITFPVDLGVLGDALTVTLPVRYLLAHLQGRLP